MKQILFLLLILILPNRALADQIYGSLRLNGTPVQGADIIVVIGNKSYSGKTDSDGVYKIFIKEIGRTQLTVNYRNKSGRFNVASYNEPVRYDFELAENPSGYTLIRR